MGQRAVDLDQRLEVAQLLAVGRDIDLFGDRHGDVAEIAHLVAEFGQALLQAGVADGARPHIDTAPAGPQVDRRADDRDIAHTSSSFVRYDASGDPSGGIAPTGLYHERD